MRGRVLIIAGSDSGGGAGIQADIKTVTALGGYAMTAITALTAQNTQGVFGIHDIPAAFVTRQIDLVMEDIGADAIKIGMLGRADIIEAVADALERWAGDIPIVLDPVMVAKGGHALLADDAVAALKSRLVPLATLLTPNIPEAEVLSGQEIPGTGAMGQVAARLRAAGAGAVLMKGGHLEGNQLTDILVASDGTETFTSPRHQTKHTHGTGCTLSSACAAGLAQDMDLAAAVSRARDYVQEAIRTAPGLGIGHGPLNHVHTVPWET